MTQGIPLPYETPSLKSSATVRAVCWTVILAIIVMSIYKTWPARAAAGIHTPPSNPTLPLLGRYVIGTQALLNSGKKADPLAPLIVQMDDAAKSPADKLRVAIISGEVESTDATAKRLNALLSPTAPSTLPTDVRHDAQTLQQIYAAGPQSIAGSDREVFKTHYEWFADVALAHGLPSTDPARERIRSQGQRTVIVLFTAGIGGALLLATGFALLVTAIVLGSMGKLRLAYQRPLRDNTYLEAFTLYLVGFLALSFLLGLLIAKLAPDSVSLGWTLLLTPVLPLAMAWPVWRGQSWRQVLQTLGWHRGKGIFVEICCGLVGYITALPLLAVMLLIALGLSRLVGASPTHPIINFVSKGPMQVVLLYVVACVFAPVVEETMFRGALFSHLRGWHGWIISAPVVGFVFAAVHPQGWTLIPALGGIGVVLCGLREWRGSLIAPMAAHALNNGTVMTILVLTMR